MNWPSARSSRAAGPSARRSASPTAWPRPRNPSGRAPRRSRNAPSAVEPRLRGSPTAVRARHCRARPRRPGTSSTACWGSPRARRPAPCRPRAPPASSRRHAILERRDLGHQRLGARLVLARLGLPDLLGGARCGAPGRPAGGDRGRRRVVEREQRARERRRPRLLQARVERRGVLANPSDVVHGDRTVRRRRGMPPAWSADRPCAQEGAESDVAADAGASPARPSRRGLALPRASSRPCATEMIEAS